MRTAHLTALLLCLLFLSAPAAAQTPLELRTTPLRLNAEDKTELTAGDLRWRGGLLLSAGDPRFGGFSDLVISPDGRRITAVTDAGRWLTARLAYDKAGNLAGIAEGQWGALRDTRGLLLSGKAEQDAEALTRLADGSLLVAYERHHRLRRFPGGDLTKPPAEITAPASLAAAEDNGGIEALVALAGDRLLAFTEGQRIGTGYAVYLRDGAGLWQGLALKPKGLFYPTGAAQLPSGDVILLERRFTLLGGLSARLRRIPLAAIQPGALLDGLEIAELRPPLTLDNFEGVAVHQLSDGTTRITLISDDNFSPLQRSLLVQFDLLKGG
ncbi:esterase-like activity of phytase family protein [Pelagibius marinus]|uniref:esterase-like activity of phytase family protein n=1 Tax=Pelagibius marinus TaxID=2762760 RepID=UPI0018732E3B|nr:esterase-like activity of phytase family protein [Pelagibius marinus]